MPQAAPSPAHKHPPGHPHQHAGSHAHDPSPNPARTTSSPSVLAWPAWLRLAAVMPMVLLLWLAVLWANEGSLPW